MKSLKINKGRVYCFDPKYKKYMTMGVKIGSVFFKEVETKHLMKIVNGYGLQYDAFLDFERNGIKEIRVKAWQTNEAGHKTVVVGIWTTTVANWLKNGKVADYGRGKQIFLSLKYMQAKDLEVVKKKIEEKEQAREVINQTKLF